MRAHSAVHQVTRGVTEGQSVFRFKLSGRPGCEGMIGV